MGNKDQLRSSMQKEEPQKRRGIWHSKAYHRFFEGYSEIKIPNPNGRGFIIQRVYTGNYYRQDLTTHQQILLRGLYVALFLGIAYLFVSSASLPLTSNSTWYVVLSQVVSVPCLFWIVVTFFSYLPVQKDVTIDGYRSSSLALQKATLGSAISLGISAVAMLIFILLNPSDKPLLEIICAVKYLAGGLIALSSNRIEKKVKYLVIPSPNIPPVDASEIK